MLKIKSNGTVKSLIQAGDSIGGRNLLLGSATNALSSTGPCTSVSGKDFSLSCNTSELQGKTLTLSIKVDINNAIAAGSGSYHRLGCEISLKFADDSMQYIGIWVELISSPRTESRRFSRTYTVMDKPIKSIESARCYLQGFTSDSAKVSEAKLEFGSIPTDWSPAPEDIDSRLTALESA